VGNVDQLLAGQSGIPKPPEKVAVSVPAEMLRRRPDVRSAELNAAAQCARIGVAKADLYPSFSLFGSIGFEAALTGPAKVDLFSSQSLVYAVGPRINWPFLNYGRLENAVRVQDARFQAQLVNYRNTVLRAVQEVEDALVALIQARQAVVFEQRAVTAAERAAELAVVQYREGSTDYQRVLDAERSLLQRQQSLTQASASVAANLIGLYRALGGGWQLRADQPFVNASTQEQMEKRTGWDGLLTEPRSQEQQQNPLQEKP
jgi:outer membrane protein TolC